jgi:hypothetical protein
MHNISYIHKNNATKFALKIKYNKKYHFIIHILKIHSLKMLKYF